MASDNFYHHQQQDHELMDTSPFPTPSCYSLPWPQNPIFTNNIRNSRNIVPCLDTASTNSMVQESGFSWISGSNNGFGYPLGSSMTHELQCMSRIKDEFSVAESYPKFLELLNGTAKSSIEDLHLHPYSSYIKNDHHQLISYSNNNQDFFLTNDDNCSNRTFSQIFPTICVNQLSSSSLFSSSSSSSSSKISSNTYDMNCLPALDPLGSQKFNGNFIKISTVSTTRSTEQSSKRPASIYMDAKANHESVVHKKSKLEQRPSSAPFQVRKEKLGDRIAAIQQLVAPFGKTDTASVLMEAIGYIKFLQTQVETLSVPYMKSTDKICGILSQEGRIEDGNIEGKRDLRSRGLCLVPLSCFSYITDRGDIQ